MAPRPPCLSALPHIVRWPNWSLGAHRAVGRPGGMARCPTPAVGVGWPLLRLAVNTSVWARRPHPCGRRSDQGPPDAEGSPQWRSDCSISGLHTPEIGVDSTAPDQLVM